MRQKLPKPTFTAQVPFYTTAVIAWKISVKPLGGKRLGFSPVATKKYSILRDTTAFAYAEQNAP